MSIKSIKQYIAAVFAAMLSLVSCSDNDEPSYDYNLVGTWMGTYSYYNPASGTKHQYLTLVLNEDGTGELEYEAPTSYSKALFHYSVSGLTVTCKGVWASTTGDMDDEFLMTLRISGKSLVPQDRYNMFVLHRDSSEPILPDGTPEDYTEALKKTWVQIEGDGTDRVLNITSDKCEVYKLNKSGQYTFYACKTDFPYDRSKQTFNDWFIKRCDEEYLVIEIGGYTYTHCAGTSNDIPKQPSLQEYLPYQRRFDSTDSKRRYCIIFEKNNKILYYEKSDVYVTLFGSERICELYATGEWRCDYGKSEIMCIFNNVSWECGELDEYKDLFPGWTYRQSCVKFMTFEALSPTEFNVTLPNGKTILMECDSKSSNL